MNIAMCDFIQTLSKALDYVEKELLGVADFHSQRIAYISYKMAESMGLSRAECIAVAQAAILHDNALKEFILDETEINEEGRAVPKHDEKFMTKHCIAGEDNVSGLPFYPLIKDAVLYHHECADGTGAFGKKTEETPLFARLIHIADIVDATWNLSIITHEKLSEVRSYVKAQENAYFDSACIDAFLSVCTYDEIIKLSGDKSIAATRDIIASPPDEVPVKSLIPFADILAKITDYKSRFTCTHSQGIAKKAREMACFYSWDEETCDKMYIAGALHDIGKLAINNDILEKPDKLTTDEYDKMRSHAQATYDILSSIRGFEDINAWASAHHEKLDGSGYPKKLTAESLGQKQRLMACLDIYQALIEERPYKAGITHNEAMAILRDMAQNGLLDASIVLDIDKCFRGKYVL